MNQMYTLRSGGEVMQERMTRARYYVNVSPTRIPGLLQTDAYHAESVLGQPGDRRLTHENLPRGTACTFFIGQAALLNQVGSQQTMRDQLTSLRNKIAEPLSDESDQIQLIGTVLGGWLTGDLIMVDDAMFSEGAVSLTPVTDEADYAYGQAYIERVAAAALHPDQSLQMIDEAMAHYL